MGDAQMTYELIVEQEVLVYFQQLLDVSYSPNDVLCGVARYVTPSLPSLKTTTLAHTSA